MNYFLTVDCGVSALPSFNIDSPFMTEKQSTEWAKRMVEELARLPNFMCAFLVESKGGKQGRLVCTLRGVMKVEVINH